MDQQANSIEKIMGTTLENLKQMMDVNTIVGDSTVLADGTLIIPVSRVNTGFVAGGGEYPAKGKSSKCDEETLPFAGGAGAGISVRPMAFLVAGAGKPVQLLPIDGASPYDRLAELLPRLMLELREWACGKHTEA